MRIINFIKNILNYILSFSTIQKVFLLIFIFNEATQGYWVYLFQNQEGSSWGRLINDIYGGLSLVCVIGFFLFWNRKNRKTPITKNNNPKPNTQSDNI